MRIFILIAILLGTIYASAQKKYVGPPNRVGREYGNPKMPLMVSHLSGEDKERLKLGNKNSKHSIFRKVLFFRRLCRIQGQRFTSVYQNIRRCLDISLMKPGSRIKSIFC